MNLKPLILLGLSLLTPLSGCTHSTGVVLRNTSRPQAGILNGGASAVTLAVEPIEARWSVTETGPGAPRGYYIQQIAYRDGAHWQVTGGPQFTDGTRFVAPANADVYGVQLRSAVMALLRKHGGSNVKVIESERVDILIHQRNRQLGGLEESQGDPAKKRWSHIDAVVVGDLSGQTRIEEEWKATSRGGGRTLRWFGRWGMGMVGSELEREKPHYRRTLTISGNLRLVDTASGNTLAVHDITAQTFEDEKSYPFKDASRLSMAPEETIIRKLLDEEVRRFCGKLVPVHFENRFEIKSSVHEASRLGVEFLGAGENERALEAFLRCTAEHPDDHRSYFAAGIACERLGRVADACNYYRQALAQVEENDIEPDDYEAQYQRALRNAESQQ